MAEQLASHYAVAQNAATSVGSELASLSGGSQVAPDVASSLMGLQNSKVAPEEYKAALDKLVAQGKLSPAVAAQLASHYSAARSAAQAA